MLVREVPTAISCFFLSLSPMMETTPLLARRHVSSPPMTKEGITSPNVRPSGVNPVFNCRSKENAKSIAYTTARNDEECRLVLTVLVCGVAPLWELVHTSAWGGHGVAVHTPQHAP